MRISAYFSRALAPLTVTAAVMLFSPPGNRSAGAQDQPAADKLSEKLAYTRAKGVPTLVVFYSTDQPASVRFASELADGAWARTNRGLVQILNVSKETDPAFVKSLGIIRFPTVALYSRGQKGVELLATITGCDAPWRANHPRCCSSVFGSVSNVPVARSTAWL